jgi:hypothetical protein
LFLKRERREREEEGEKRRFVYDILLKVKFMFVVGSRKNTSKTKINIFGFGRGDRKTPTHTS